MRLWAGLGYYSRARNLLAAAKTIVAEHGGSFPSEFDAVLALPGIGRYTAGAVLSIAFQKPVPLVDGNVARVFSRLFAVRGSAKDPDAMRRYWEIAERLVSRDRPGDWNQALMELGATVCAPESPRCDACPVSGLCEAFAQGLQDELPPVAARKAPIDLAWTCLLIEKGGRLLLWKRAEDERFLKGHWALPEARHLEIEPGEKLRTVRHTITHHRITIELRRAAPPASLSPSARWFKPGDAQDRLVSSLWRKCLSK